MDGDNRSATEQAQVIHLPETETGTTHQLSTRVLMALDELPGYDVENPDHTLFGAIDPDALDALFGPDPDSDGSVTFTIEGYRVTATAAGAVVVQEF